MLTQWNMELKGCNIYRFREMTGQQRNRVFVADEILNVIMTERTKSVSLPED